ncbi:MAG: NAD kinase [Paludibacteraceae bacterium]|nr:NAD kinase [Paludibacteraceae bacterium]
MTIALFGNTLRPETIREVKHIIDFLQQRGVDIVLSQELRHEAFNREFPSVEDYISHTGETIDFALSVGGDGTFLTTAALVGHLDIPILGINCGHLGYLAEVQTEDIDAVLDQLLTNSYTIEQRRMLEVSCQYDNKIVSPYALNEIAILKSGLSSMITVDVTLNGQFLHNYKADGLLIATPTGSTAYNLSVGGPLLDPHVHAIILSPVATHSLNIRPLVVLDDSMIDIKITSRNGNFLLSIDGRSQVLSQDIQLHIERSQRTIKLVRINGQTFMQSLKEKLYWGK